MSSHFCPKRLPVDIAIPFVRSSNISGLNFTFSRPWVNSTSSETILSLLETRYCVRLNWSEVRGEIKTNLGGSYFVLILRGFIKIEAVVIIIARNHVTRFRWIVKACLLIASIGLKNLPNNSTENWIWSLNLHVIQSLRPCSLNLDWIIIKSTRNYLYISAGNLQHSDHQESRINHRSNHCFSLFKDGEEKEIHIKIAPKMGQDIRKKGSDIKKGETVLKSGSKIGPIELGLLASIGITLVPVYRKPKVALLSTGDEVYFIHGNSRGLSIVRLHLYWLTRKAKLNPWYIIHPLKASHGLG